MEPTKWDINLLLAVVSYIDGTNVLLPKSIIDIYDSWFILAPASIQHIQYVTCANQLLAFVILIHITSSADLLLQYTMPTHFIIAGGYSKG